jgi:hypothetical protein
MALPDAWFDFNHIQSLAFTLVNCGVIVDAHLLFVNILRVTYKKKDSD